jgi:Helix-turn-helix domain
VSDGSEAQHGARLRLARQARGLSQQQLADVAGVSRQAISPWESGEHDPQADDVAPGNARILCPEVFAEGVRRLANDLEERGPRARAAPYMYPARRAIAVPAYTFSEIACSMKPSGAMIWTSFPDPPEYTRSSQGHGGLPGSRCCCLYFGTVW